MTPEELIDALDAALADSGETIRLLRMATPPATGVAFTVSCLAVLRGYAPSELAPGSGIVQEDQKLILSPSEITKAGWPGLNQSRVPRKGDRIVSNRGVLTIQAAAGIYVADVLVRIEAQVRGA